MTETGGEEGTEKKWLLAIDPGAPWSDESLQIFRDWGSGVAETGVQSEMEWWAVEAHHRFTGSRAQPPFCAFLSVFADAAFDPAHLGTPTGMQVAILGLRPQSVFDRSRSEPGCMTPGLKKTTLWRARGDLDPVSWQARYHAHASLVPSVHGSAWRYCQNVIEEGPTGLPYQAVSELWWPTDEALLERFYTSEEAQRLVAEDTQGFIDIPSAIQTVTRHERLTRGR
ncbi:MAG: hypothetical protein GY910_05865 [bacterium]|nr:hypothetical protein [Deltaproteobacteria bacterium]MCP4904487.1 hypothetical protein [bacterium]